MNTARRAALRTVSVTAAALAATGLAVAVAPPASAATPAFVQQVSTHVVNKASVTVTPSAVLTSGNRLVVEVMIWNSGHSTARSVTDAAGDTFSELLTQVAGDGTELSVWSAPITSGGGTASAITVTPTGTADIGVVAAEYSGLAGGTGLTAVDTMRSVSGSTAAAATVSSGATLATSSPSELAVGFYADSGFSTAIGAGSGYTSRANVSPTGDAQLLVEDQVVTSAGAQPTATASTGARVPWSMAIVVFYAGTPTTPRAPSSVTATGGDRSAVVSWMPDGSRGSAVTSYTVTPYVGTVAGTPVVVSGNPPLTTATVTGLTNGTTYTFRVSATNGVGAGAAAVSNTVVPDASPGGTMTPLQTWPIVALATHLLYTGKIVAWDGWQQPQPTVFGDPTDPTSLGTVNAPDSVFCDGGATLPDGRLLVVGGYGGLSTGQLGIVDTNIFDPATNTWRRVADMNYPRWYPTLTELSDGRYVALSGNSINDGTWADTPEVYDPTTNKWTLLSRINTSEVHEVEYPFSYELPNGKVFVIGPEEDNSHVLDVDAQTWTSTGSVGYFNGSSVMYRPGKVLYSGGAAFINTPSPAGNDAATIDLNAATPTWTRTNSMNYAREYHTLTMLADGTVLAVGGANTSDQHVITTGVLPTEIWNPDTGVWSTAAPISASRNYHSTAVLMPDGRVLIAGGGHPNSVADPGQYSAQFYSPAYLSRGTRPVISSAPSLANYGSSFAVSSTDASSITGVNLVSLGADTHQIDMNQHFVPLSYTASGTTLQVQAPANGALAPPGYYMLFILKNGVPSVAKMIQIGGAQAATAPGAPGNVTASAGNTSALVSWTAPSSGGSAITGYTVTPYIGAAAQPSTTITGTPPATSATISGLANGTSYTFKVTATNAVGTGSPSAASNAVTPATAPPAAYVQSTTAVTGNGASLSATLPAAVGAGNRMIVQVGVWNSARSKATAVTDTAGNTYTEVSSVVASDGTEQSVWTAPITTGGAAPTITAKVGAAADVGISVSEYTGLSSASGSAAVDVSASATGSTSGAATVSSGSTAAASASDLAIGFYADSGFGDTIAAGSGWTQRANFSPDSRMEVATEDRSLSSGATAAATFSSSARTVWLATTVAFRTAGAAATAPGAPTGVSALPGNGSARLSWTAPSDGGSVITGYTVTPYTSGVAGTPIQLTGTATSTTVNGLTNGSSYNFTVTATNAKGSGPPSTLSNTVVPTATRSPQYVQGVSSQTANRATLTAALPSALTAGNRLVVEVGVWNSAHSLATGVSDSAGNTYTELLHFTASDGTEMSVWSAPVTATGGSAPTVTATAGAAADVGIAVAEYSGLASTNPVDVSATATATTATAQPVSSGSTAMTTAGTGLAIGFYADSGFGSTLTPDAGYQQRQNLSPNGNMDLLMQDSVVTAGATPAPSVGTGGRVVWLAATIVFRTS